MAENSLLQVTVQCYRSVGKRRIWLNDSFTQVNTAVAATRLNPAWTDRLNEARALYPDFGVQGRLFIDYLTDKQRQNGDGELMVNDLYLAFGCVESDPRALARFETDLMPRLRVVLRRFRMSNAALADVEQQLRVLLFVHAPDKPAKIAQYSGRAPLIAWLQVVAARLALRALRGEDQNSSSDDELLQALPTPTHAPDVHYLKERYREPFRQAFREAVAALEPKQRTLLRQSYLDNLSIDDLGRLYGVHRATCARWLVEARKRALSSTRERLMQALAVSENECSEILDMVQSRLDLTMRGLLATYQSEG